MRISDWSSDVCSSDRLPTEAEFVDVLGVSRTVIREAIARLAAAGLVEARQGKGLFVSETARYQAFQITRDEVENLSDVIELLELRLCVETEMAALAAERRSEVDVMNRSEEHTSELQSLMRISYAVFCLKKKKGDKNTKRKHQRS